MVCPILISVGVTPRISADIASGGSIRQATAPSAPTEVTKRICITPLVSSVALGRRGAAGIWLQRAGTCHAMAFDATILVATAYDIGIKKRGVTAAFVGSIGGKRYACGCGSRPV